jgi:superfamily II DNA or RNA helicase
MDRLGGRFGMLVVDEAHHFGGGQHDEALEMCAAPLRLGLTATPPADAVARETLERLVGPVVYQLSVDDLAGRYLAAYELSTLWIELTREERQAYEREMAVFRPVHRAYTSTSLDPSWPGFAAWAGRSDEGRRALAAVRRARDLLALPSGKLRVLESLLAQHRRRRVLVFTADNASAYAVSRRCLIHPITCDIGAKERDEVLARFRSGEIRALVSSRVLNEGLDVPDAEVGIVLGGRLGDREHVQRVGRVLRPADGKRALVYELVVQETTEVRAWVRRRRALASP